MMFSAIYQPCLTACQVKVLQIDVDKYFRKEKQAEKIVKWMLEQLALEAKSPTTGFILVRLCARLIHWPFDFHE